MLETTIIFVSIICITAGIGFIYGVGLALITFGCLLLIPILLINCVLLDPIQLLNKLEKQIQELK